MSWLMTSRGSSRFVSAVLWKQKLNWTNCRYQIPPPPHDIWAPLTCSLIHWELIGQDPANFAEGWHLDSILLQLTLHVVDLLLWERRQHPGNRWVSVSRQRAVLGKWQTFFFPTVVIIIFLTMILGQWAGKKNWQEMTSQLHSSSQCRRQIQHILNFMLTLAKFAMLWIQDDKIGLTGTERGKQMHRLVFQLTSEIYFSIQILDLRGQAKLEQVQTVKEKQ